MRCKSKLITITAQALHMRSRDIVMLMPVAQKRHKARRVGKYFRHRSLKVRLTRLAPNPLHFLDRKLSIRLRKGDSNKKSVATD